MKKLAFLFSILLSNAALSEELYPSYIDFIYKSKIYNFQLVQMNENEEPFISLSNIAIWSETSLDCASDVCQISFENNHYIISKSQGSVTNDKGLVKHYTNSEIIEKNDQLWIKYNKIEELLPFKVVWSVKSYEVFLNPLFKLSSELDLEYETMKNNARNRVRSHIEPEVYNGNMDTQYLFQIEHEWNNNRGAEPSANLQSITDINKGTLSINALMNSSEKAIEGNYENTNLESLEYLRIGSGRTPTSSVYSSSSSQFSIYIDKIRTLTASNTFIINEDVGLNTVTDVFVNGFYVKTIDADKFGHIYDQIIASPNDIVSLKKYKEKGKYEEESFTVEGDSFLLKKEIFDYEIYIDPYMERDMYRISYGILDSLTIGLTSEANKEEELQYLSFMYQYNYYLSLYSNINSDFIQGDLSFSYFKNTPVGLRYGIYNNESDSSINDKNYISVYQNWSSGRFSQSNEITVLDSEYKIHSINRLKINRDLTVTSDNKYKKNMATKSSAFDNDVYLNSTLNDRGSWKIGVNFSDTIMYYARFKYDYSDIFSAPTKSNYLSVGGSYEQSRLKYNLAINYNINDHVSTEVSLDNENITLSVKTGLLINNRNERIQSKSSFGKSEICGYILNTQTKKGMNGIRIRVANDETISDENGFYCVSKIPANTEVQLNINESDLDIDVMLEKNNILISTRPSTYMTYNINVVPIVGVDGFVKINHAYKLILRKNDFYKEYTLDEDGFFTFEKIPSGKDYIFDIMDDNSKLIKTISYDMLDSYWISGIIIDEQ